MGSLTISGGRVVDPASGTDAVADVAVLDGKIAAIGTELGDAERAIDAAGLVVAPGFIDCMRTASRSQPTACRWIRCSGPSCGLLTWWR
jgi:predicted amidohydrolase